MSRLQVKGFGGLDLSGNGRAVHSFPTHHVEELLGFLLLNQNRACSRDQLIELLWPHDATVNGRHCLSTVLWRLRGVFRQLGLSARSYLRTTRDYVIFSPSRPLNFDVESFQQQLDIAWSTKQDDARIDRLCRAIDLYQGDLYGDIFADWCLIERERLARMHLQALGDLLHCYIRQRELSKAVDIGQRILSIDPLREEIHRALIYCYGQLGYRSEAAAQFHLCADSLMNELQVLPMPDTVCIYQQILAGCTNYGQSRLNYELLARARKANIEFQQAGDKLIRILDEIENMDAATFT